MNRTSLGHWMMGYGLFLIAMGVAGYLSNPAKAATALISGGTFGVLSILWGWILKGGASWARWASLVTTGFLTCIFAWRSTVSWGAVAEGQSEKLIAALLITAMGTASILTLVKLTFTRSVDRTSAPALS